MKNKTLTNKKLVSALMVGISAMITLQTPITAYASGDVAPLPDGDGGTPDTTSEAVQDVYNYIPITNEAQEQAEVAQEAISNVAAENQDGAGQEVVEGASELAQEAANLILSGDAEDNVDSASATEAGTKVNDEIQELIEAAEAVVQDGPQIDGSVAPSAISDFGNASTKIEEVKTDLIEADKANEDAEKAYITSESEAKEMVDSAKVMIETSEAMAEETKTADEKAAELIESIQDASSQEEAEKAYQDLEKLVTDMNGDLAAKKALYDQMAEDYVNAVLKLEQAQKDLDAAEQKFDDKVSSAVQGTLLAETSVAEAQRKVDNLAEALEKVEDSLSDEANANELSTYMKSNEWASAFGDVKTNRKLMKEVVVNYYIPQVLGIDILADEVDFDKDFVSVSGAEGQEYNYHQLTFKYKDENGDIQTGVKYFNWDSLTKINLGNLGLGSKVGIVVFEKTDDEINADKLVKEYYAGQSILKDNQKKNAYNKGLFDVFTYVDGNGEKKYLIRDQITNAEDSEKFTFAEDGTPASYDGHELTMVVQNQNNLLHEGNCIIVGSNKNIEKYLTHDTEVRKKVVQDGHGNDRLSKETVQNIIDNSKALNNFVIQNAVAKNPNTAALMNKYTQYQEATKEAKAAAAKATAEVNKLADAIDDIQEKGKNKKSRLAVEVLGTSDIATALGISVSEEKAASLNGMTVRELIAELNDMKADADQKAADAQAKAAEVQTKFDNAVGVLGKTIARLTPSTGGGGDGGADFFAGGGGDLGGEIGGAAGIRVVAAGAVQGGVALENNAAGGTNGVALENDASGGTNGVALENAGASGGGVVEIGDEMVALSDGVAMDSADQDSRPIIVGSQSVVKASEEKVVTIEEEDTALSATAETGTIPQKKSWWWLLIIAILGATGEKMYKEHQRKKEEKLRAEDDEWD